jgi:hypothetical protein
MKLLAICLLAATQTITRDSMKRYLLLLLFATYATAQTVVPWPTRNFDNARSGFNTHETVLTQASVRAKGISFVTTIPECCDARGGEAQPLVATGVTMRKDGKVHNIIVLPSMSSYVRAVDFVTGADLWDVSLGTPVLETPNPNIDMYAINQHWGCLSTGVIDTATNRWYGVCQISPDGTGNIATAREYMFVLNLSDGSQVVPPVMLQGIITLADGTAGPDFNAQWKKVRSSAALYNFNGRKVVVEGGGNVYMTHAGVGGYIFAFDTATNKFTSLLGTSNGLAANIWNSGSGVSIDSKGNIYALTATGYFDAKTNFAESALQLTYDGSLHIKQWWAPYLDMQRTGQIVEPTMLSGANPPVDAMNKENMPVNGMKSTLSFKSAKVTVTVNPLGQIVTLVHPSIPTGDWADQDFGSDMLAMMEPLGVLVASDKDGIAYSIKMANMGNTSVADLQNPAVNYAKLAAPCFWLTVYPGTSCSPQDPQALNFLPNGVTAHLHMTPVQMYDPILKSWVLFVWGENQNLRKVAVSATGQLTYIAEGHEFASNDVRNNPGGGMTGGFCTGSSNGSDPNSMILVCAVPYGDANKTVTQGRLLVYDPVHLAKDGSLQVLWDSQQWGWNFTFNKFMPPVIDGGEVILPNYSGGVMVFKLTGN